MGFLTTVTFRNDFYQKIVGNKEEIFQVIEDAMCGDARRHEFRSDIICQKTRHASNTTAYVHAGNLVIDPIELDPICNKEYFDQCIKVLEGKIEDMKAKRAERKNEAGN